jgi:hypothetical protein
LPFQASGIRNFPANVLIDTSGKIVAHNLKGEELEKKLAELFAKKCDFVRFNKRQSALL